MQGLQLPAGKRAWLLQPVLRSASLPGPGGSRPSSPAHAQHSRPPTPSRPARIGGPPQAEATASAEAPARQSGSVKPSTRPGVRPPIARQAGPVNAGSQEAPVPSANSACPAEYALAPRACASALRPNSADRRPDSAERRRSAVRPSSADRRPDSIGRRRSEGCAEGAVRNPGTGRMADFGQRIPYSARNIEPVRSQSERLRARRPQSARSSRAAERKISHHQTSNPPPAEENILDLAAPQQAAAQALEMLAAEDAREKEARLGKQLQIRAWLQRKDAEQALRRQAEKEEKQIASEQERLRQQRQEDREVEMTRQKIVRLQAHARRQQSLVSDIERATVTRAKHGVSEGGLSCKGTMAVALTAYASPRPPSVREKRHC